MSFNLGSILDPNKIAGPEMVQVVILGVGIVFFGLVCIVAICTIMSKVLKNTGKEEKVEIAQTPATQVASTPIANKQELIAVVSAVIAEEMGTDVEAIRIKSIKRV